MAKLTTLTGVLFCCSLLTACAGLHNVPPQSYIVPENVVRIAFDQAGNIYPRSGAREWPRGKIIGWNKRWWVEDFFDGSPKRPYDQTAIYEEVSKELAVKLDRAQTKKLIFLIHGYNNSFGAAEAAFRGFRFAIEDGDRKIQPVYVEVFWDGLKRGPFTLPFPLFYWFDALTYSNHAGQVGLRRVLNRLPPNADVVILTHSRGAGLALAAFSNPTYDPCCEPRVSYEELDATALRRLRIISIAPAVGFGHHDKQMRQRFPAETQIFIGFNERDPALRKSLSQRSRRSGRFGDTRLGADDAYFLSVASDLNLGEPFIQRVIYQDYSEHGIEGYLNRTEPTQCLFWAAGLHEQKPDKCHLTRPNS